MTGRNTTIGRIEKLEKLTAALEKVSHEAEELEEKRSARETDIANLRASLKDRERDLNEIKRELTEIGADESRATAKKEALAETLAALRKENGDHTANV